MTILEIRELRARYSSSGPEILRGISFDVAEDDFLAIIGCPLNMIISDMMKSEIKLYIWFSF